MPALVWRDENVGDRRQNSVELGPHSVLELKPSRTLLELDLLVVRQVDAMVLDPALQSPA